MTMHSKGTPVFRMAKGGNVTSMTRLQLEEYITKNYLPTISSAEFTYSFTENSPKIASAEYIFIFTSKSIFK